MLPDLTFLKSPPTGTTLSGSTLTLLSPLTGFVPASDLSLFLSPFLSFLADSFVCLSLSAVAEGGGGAASPATGVVPGVGWAVWEESDGVDVELVDWAPRVAVRANTSAPSNTKREPLNSCRMTSPPGDDRWDHHPIVPLLLDACTGFFGNKS